MRLSEWRATAPYEMCMTDQVLATLAPALAGLGVEEDPECMVVWGDSPNAYYSIMASTPAGLASVVVRLKGPDDQPRATAKLIRWSKLQVSDFSVESFGGHRLVSAQVDAYSIKGTDAEGDLICDFVRGLLASADGRVAPIVVAGALPAAAMPQAAVMPQAPAAKAASAKGGPAKEESPAAKAGPARKGGKAAAAPPAPAPADQLGWVGPQPGAPAAPSAPAGATPAGPTAPPTPGPTQPARPVGPYVPDTGVWDVPEPKQPEPEESKRPRWAP